MTKKEKKELKRKQRKERKRMEKIKLEKAKILLAKKKKKEEKEKKKKKAGRPSRSRKGGARKDNYKSSYTAEDMAKAIKMVQEEGYAVKRAAEICGVKRITLHDRLKGLHSAELGRPPVLTPEEEEAFVQILIQMGNFNYPLTQRGVIEMVKDYLDRHRNTRKGHLTNRYHNT